MIRDSRSHGRAPSGKTIQSAINAWPSRDEPLALGRFRYAPSLPRLDGIAPRWFNLADERMAHQIGPWAARHDP